MGGNGLHNDLRDCGDRDSEELFCLRWNDYRDNVVTTLSELRREEDFFDVTLSVDGRQVRAHKLILSACSLFFRRLLRANPAPNPLVVLWDVAFDDVVNILDFMYNGEVKVRHSNIQTFLALAERFRVRGLCQNESASGRNSPVATGSSGNNNARRKSGEQSPPGPKMWNDSPGPSSRRGSIDDGPPKRPRFREADNDILKPVVSIKEESLLERKKRSSVSGDVEGAGQEDSQMSHSGAGSEADYDYGLMEGPSGQGLPSSIMDIGMPSALMDAAAAKEFWRRAAAMSFGSTSSVGFGSRNLTSPVGGGSGGAGGCSPSGAGGIDAPRRQRSVFTSQQVAHLEAYFRVSEYIDGERKKELSNLTNLPEHQIKVWFQNRRQKKKRESEPDYTSDSPSRPSGGLGNLN